MREVLLTSIFLVSTIAHADDYLDCTTESGERIRFGTENAQVFYEFSKAGHGELRLDRDVDDVVVTHWPGVGDTIWNSVQFQQEGYYYAVFTSLERKMPDDENAEIETEFEAGVYIAQKAPEDIIGSKICAAYEVMPELDFVETFMAEFGLEYDFAKHEWVSMPNS